MIERIELILGRQEKTFTAAMLWDDAPRTCEVIATMLADGPIEGLTYHAIYSGHEFYVRASGSGTGLPVRPHAAALSPEDSLPRRRSGASG